MSNSLNTTGSAHAGSLVAAGKVNKTADWSMSAEDENSLLGPDKDNWANYSLWFLGKDTSADSKTKAYYKYPFGKNGEVYRSALIAIKQRGSAEGDDDIAGRAGTLLDAVDGKRAVVRLAGDSRMVHREGVVRAWASLDIKATAVKDGKRTFNGIASTPATDRMGDVVEPLGAQFKLPLPLLWQHDSQMPVGQITGAKASKTGITVSGYVEDLAGPPSLKDDLDRAWAMMTSGLVRGLSIGFRDLKSEALNAEVPWGPLRFLEWEWMELSAVTIPANPDAIIQDVVNKGLFLNELKRLDDLSLHASLGRRKQHEGVVYLK